MYNKVLRIDGVIGTLYQCTMYNEGTRIDGVIGTLYQCTIKY